MTDRLSKEQRSKLMSKILCKGSKMELKMKAALESNNIMFEYQPKMYGRPDFLIGQKIAVFCDSSFWHGRNWKKLEKQLTKEYWVEHINRNRKRDRQVNRTLKKNGYIVLRFWEEDVMKKTELCIAKIKQTQESLLDSKLSFK
jgi:DNA mismatch endonuclease, patch repair protein